MILSRFLSECGDTLDDERVKYPADQLVRTLDRQLLGAFRDLVQGNKNYSNFTMSIPASAAVQVLDNVWEFRLPTWIMHVVLVSRRDGSPTIEPTTSPYTWTGAANVRIGATIERYVPDNFRPHWRWDGNHTLRLVNFGEVPQEGLVIQVVVRPPPMVQFTLDVKNASASKLTLPVDMLLGEIDSEEGAFINCEFQVTATNSETSTNLGLVRRGVYSSGVVTSGGDARTEITFDAAWTSALSIGDVVDSVLPIPSEHCRLLVLRTVMACYQKKPNVKGMALIQAELNFETQKFEHYAAWRDTHGPSHYKRHDRRAFRPYDPNRSNWYQ